MDTTGHSSNFSEQGKDAAQRTADKVQGSMNDAKNLVDDTGTKLLNKVENFRSTAGSALANVADQAKTLANQTKDAVGNATQQFRETTSDATDSLLTYTKENPVKALLWAGAAGALVATLIQALTPSRD